jgi:hypothetical protein
MSRAALVGVLAVVCAGCGSAPHDIATAVPIGSSLSELDRWLERGRGSFGEVTGSFVEDRRGKLVKKDWGFLPG